MTISAGARPATVNHELHPQHKLSLVNIPSSWFNCDVCKRHGEGTEHYRCEPCNFDAHADCATAPPTLKHVNYAGDLVLYAAPDASNPQIYYCGLCGREVLGYRYYNRDHDCRLHPCCALLPRRVVQDGRAFDLDNYPSAVCGMCRKIMSASSSSLSYRSRYDDGEEVFLHVRCLVDTNNRLTGYQNWVASAPIRPGVLGSFTRKEGSSFTSSSKKEAGGDLGLGISVSHVMHPEHRLTLVNTHEFNCDVCKQYGKGTEHYRCEPCDFDAHPVCATAPLKLKHANYAGDFVLYAAPPDSGNPQTYYCAACGRHTLGYRYYNRDHDCRLHPCCAFLPGRVVQDGRAFHLGYHSSGMCGMCRKNSATSLSYRSGNNDGKDVYLHVRCLVDSNNRLTGYQDWVASAPIRPGVLASAPSISATPRKKEGSVDFFKAATTSLKIASAVLKVANLDFDGVGDAVATLDFDGVGDAVATLDFDGLDFQ